MALTTRFGPFELLEPLAEGGMGELWLAHPVDVPGAGPLAVVKTVREDLADDADSLQRFLDETRVGLLLHHPCICRVVDAGRVGGERYLALDVVDGIDLRRLVERAGQVPADVALWIGALALDGLSHAHTARHPLTGAPLGVVHRDVSPHNVMVSVDGSARLIDFGLAVSSVKEARTEQGIVLGKLAYMAPEQARGDPVDERTDVFATGMVIYELIANDRYWGDLARDEIWMRAGIGDHVPRRWALIDADIREVLVRLLAADGAARPDAATARDLLLTVLEKRGGARAARASLGRLVGAHARDELARIERARDDVRKRHPAARDASPTESLAAAEVKAIEALLRQRAEAPTLLLAAADAPVVPDVPVVPVVEAAPRARGDSSTDVVATPQPSRRRSAIAAVVLAAVVIAGALVGATVLVPTGRDREPHVATVDAGPAPAAGAPSAPPTTPRPAPPAAAPPAPADILATCPHTCAEAIRGAWARDEVVPERMLRGCRNTCEGMTR